MSQAERLLETLNPEEYTKRYVLKDQEYLNTHGDSKNPYAHCKHIFEADDDGKIERSGCDKFRITRQTAIEPLSAIDMRKKAAEDGRAVCGTCVSTLYGKESSQSS